jgi:hypothetical protein
LAVSGANPQELGFMSKLVIVLAILLIAAGALWHGVTLDAWHRFMHDLLERPDGPMRFRFVLQPLMAVIAACRGGVQDARAGRTPHFWAIAFEPQERAARLREGLNATARIILLGLVMDVIYQVIVLKTFYPVEALIIALLLAFVPYLLIRGPATRVARRWRGGVSGSDVR